MSIQVGKIIRYEKGTGDIVAEDGKYLFLESDIKDGNKLKENDLVIFRGEKVHDINKAFFVKKIDKTATTTYSKILTKKED